MKKFVTLFILITTCGFLSAQNIPEQRIETEINSIVVYLEGSEVTRNKKVEILNGRNLIIFERLSPKLNAKSIRVSTDDDISVLSISSKADYLTKIEEKPRIKELKDSLKMISQKVTSFNDEKQAYNVEKELLKTNISIGGTNNGVSIAELKQAADYYRTRMIEINKRISEIERITLEQKSTKIDLQNELRELNASLNYSRTEVAILLSSEKNITTDI